MSKIGKKNNGQVLLARPHITEKATMLNETNKFPIYTFVVDPSAHKTEIKKAIVALYKVTPVKINIINMPAKKVTRRGKVGTTTATKKALVFLKVGDKIEMA
ncbi:MAG: 50S ribosomal protein L23 [Candidatus Vogelbacteria bacterium RIFOXYD2_FULL_44_9]|uniref:Large ribosomal subunit protein uL23 n=1 Tax=Candidatus Vogelbacteria bacterium RIFOXYD2_FULL_44_9 TaxID=1802441 RepID=A0A1G2QK16_9BACT|nr:MAG: 50S ribosomal protein L23 [Candidatus Vogelbacteria bacterium RIFOXYD2_FULL_44_9]